MAQRITNSMLIMNFNRNLRTNMNKMSKYQSQLETNRRIVRMSDDAVGTVKSLDARSKLNDLEQFNRNVDDARNWMTASETALYELNDVIKRAQELATKAANEGVLAPEDQVAISREIGQLRDHVVTIMNTTLGDKYIFGGFNVTKAPFEVQVQQVDPADYDIDSGEIDADGNPIMVNSNGDPMPKEWELTRTILFNGTDMVNPEVDANGDPLDPPFGTLTSLDKVLNYEIGFDIYMDIGTKGASAMGIGDKDNIFHVFNEFYKALNDPDTYTTQTGVDNNGDPIMESGLRLFIGQFQDLQSHVLADIADIGGRMNRLDRVSDRYGQDEINYTQMKSNVEDLDQAEAIMWYQMTEAVYRAALSVGGRVMQQSLMDFLK